MLLLGIVGWKAGKMQDRSQLLCLFEMDMMQPLFAATEVSYTESYTGFYETFHPLRNIFVCQNF